MKKRNVLMMLVCIFVLTMTVFFVGCAQQETAEVAEEPAEMEAEAMEAEPIYTKDDPGAWEGKQSSHIPVIAYEKTETGLNVTVTVNHVMDPEIPHFITLIKLMDGDGNLLGQEEFQATDEKAVATFELASVPAKLVAHEKCNVHGTWMEEVTVE